MTHTSVSGYLPEANAMCTQPRARGTIVAVPGAQVFVNGAPVSLPYEIQAGDRISVKRIASAPNWLLERIREEETA